MIAIYQGSMDPSQPYSDQCLGTRCFRILMRDVPRPVWSPIVGLQRVVPTLVGGVRIPSRYSVARWVPTGGITGTAT